MSRALMPTLGPTLPYDVLRIIFEFAATEDKREAVKLAIVSRLTQQWVEWVLYSVVNLHRESTSRAFLRTIETSKTKTRHFFATRVKSLCISYDIYHDHTAKIVSACRGVTTLTFCVVPLNISCLRKLPSYLFLSQLQMTTALEPLRPKRLSVLLHGLILGSPNPPFQMPFFTGITHLSVFNRWEEWTLWCGFDLLPCLTHLSFDLRVGPRELEDEAASAVAHALSAVLTRCPDLKVCALMLSFDPHPRRTAGKVVGDMFIPDPRLVFVSDGEPFWDREAHSMREARVWEEAGRLVARQQMRFNASDLLGFFLSGYPADPIVLEVRRNRS